MSEGERQGGEGSAFERQEGLAGGRGGGRQASTADDSQTIRFTPEAFKQHMDELQMAALQAAAAGATEAAAGALEGFADAIERDLTITANSVVAQQAAEKTVRAIAGAARERAKAIRERGFSS